MTDRFLDVIAVGARATVQDAGRPGHAHLGVPRSGALDAPAHRLANRLVSNHEDAAALEVLLGGVTVRPTVATALAVTGAPCPVRVDGRERAWGERLSVAAGAVVDLGPATRGLRSYLAVAGAVAVPAVLGSRSTDELSGLGPPPVHAGDRLPLGEPGRAGQGLGGRSGDGLVGGLGGGEGAAFAVLPAPVAEPHLRVLPGPHLEMFALGSWEVLTGAAWSVTGAANRVGVRLAGPGLARVGAAELPSEGMVLGAVQVPPDGSPVVFLHDHPTTGGYPVVAVVVEADLGVLAQLRPGGTLRLRDR